MEDGYWRLKTRSLIQFLIIFTIYMIFLFTMKKKKKKKKQRKRIWIAYSNCHPPPLSGAPINLCPCGKSWSAWRTLIADTSESSLCSSTRWSNATGSGRKWKHPASWRSAATRNVWFLPDYLVLPCNYLSHLSKTFYNDKYMKVRSPDHRFLAI